MSLQACQSGAGAPQTQLLLPAAQETAKPDPLLAQKWMETVRALVQQEAISPPAAARIYAYTSIALYESVRTADQPTLAGRLNRLDSLPQLDADKNELPEMTAQASLEKVLHHLLPTLSPQSQEKLKALKTELLGQTSQVEAEVRERSQSRGQALGEQLITWINSDGFAEVRQPAYTLPAANLGIGIWQPTAVNQKPLEPYWGNLKPLVLIQAAQCPSAPQVNFNTATNSAFYQQAQEVQQAVAQLSDVHKQIAQWWADGPGSTPTPPGHWVAIAGQVSKAQGFSVAKTAEVYALTSIALMDAFIACWHTKYQVNLLRPVTFIQEIMGDKDWASFIATPPFPEYPSGHSTGSGAAAEILTALIGEQVAFRDETNLHLGLPAREYASFRTAGQEAAISRLYGGIHFRDAIDQGLSQGKCVADAVIQKLK